MVVQPLETAIVRSIDVREGQTVQAGAGAGAARSDLRRRRLGALAAQVASLQAEVARLQAEADGKPFAYTGLDPNLALQAAIYAQRQAEYNFKLENYQQKINGLAPTIATRAVRRGRLPRAAASRPDVEQMRKELERLQVGSKLNTLAAMDNRAGDASATCDNAEQTADSAQRDLAALVAERNGYCRAGTPTSRRSCPSRPASCRDARE